MMLIHILPSVSSRKSLFVNISVILINQFIPSLSYLNTGITFSLSASPRAKRGNALVIITKGSRTPRVMVGMKNRSSLQWWQHLLFFDGIELEGLSVP